MHSLVKTKEICVCVFWGNTLNRVHEDGMLCWVKTSYFAVAPVVNKVQDEQRANCECG